MPKLEKNTKSAQDEEDDRLRALRDQEWAATGLKPSLHELAQALILTSPFAFYPRFDDLKHCADASLDGAAALNYFEGVKARAVPCAALAHNPSLGAQVVTLGMSPRSVYDLFEATEGEVLPTFEQWAASDRCHTTELDGIAFHMIIDAESADGARARIDLTLGQLRYMGVDVPQAFFTDHTDPLEQRPTTFYQGAAGWEFSYFASPHQEKVMALTSSYHAPNARDDRIALMQLALRCKNDLRGFTKTLDQIAPDVLDGGVAWALKNQARASAAVLAASKPGYWAPLSPFTNHHKERPMIHLDKSGIDIKKSVVLQAMCRDIDPEYVVATFVSDDDNEDETSVTFTREEADALVGHLFQKFEVVYCPKAKLGSAAASFSRVELVDLPVLDRAKVHAAAKACAVAQALERVPPYSVDALTVLLDAFAWKVAHDPSFYRQAQPPVNSKAATPKTKKKAKGAKGRG
jgi:hypothetical protein